VADPAAAYDCTEPVPYEFANIIQRAHAKGRLTAADMQDALELVSTLDIRVRHRWDKTNLVGICKLMAQFSLTAYDSSYLGIALDEGLPLATLDQELRAAAHSSGVTLAL
jgi:predicted nucleic acid-binding protein